MKRADQATTVFFIVLTAAYVLVAQGYPGGARTVPTIVGGVTLVIAVVQLVGAKARVLKPFVGTFDPGDDAEVFRRPELRRRLYAVSASLIVLCVMIYVLGIAVTLPLWTAAFVAFLGRQRPVVVVASVLAITLAVFGLLILLLGFPWDEGLLWELMT